MEVEYMSEINQFINETYFLSNFYEAEVRYNHITYPHNESAFQAQKTHDEKVRKIFKKLTPNEAKRLGKTIYLRQDWNKVKDNIMYEICLAKFQQNPELKQKLLETGNKELIEGNMWHDKYWGIYKNQGKNKLGKILMKVREEIREQKPTEFGKEMESKKKHKTR